MQRSKAVVFAVLVTLSAPGALAGQSAFSRWQASAGQFSSWQRSGVSLAADGALQLDLQTAAPG
ncbi:MAG TPA: hypothetical protein VF664_12250, partial [Cystobacter sp.]